MNFWKNARLFCEKIFISWKKVFFQRASCPTAAPLWLPGRLRLWSTPFVGVTKGRILTCSTCPINKIIFYEQNNDYQNQRTGLNVLRNQTKNVLWKFCFLVLALGSNVLVPAIIKHRIAYMRTPKKIAKTRFPLYAPLSAVSYCSASIKAEWN